MTHVPRDFPWQVLAALGVAVFCFAGAAFCVLVAVGRALRDRRHELTYRAWDDYPCEFSREWRRSGR